MSAASVNCPRCGTALLPSAPEGLCPRCLGALNFATETVLPGEEKTAAQRPLTPEQLAVHFPQLEIIECLGRGGMGVVYRARQKSLNRMVALKLLAPERVQDAKFAERFTHEAQALAKLSHPNIVTIHDFGEAGGFFFLLMEFVDGVNLRQLLRSRKLTPEEALAIVPPLCDALQYAHERGIVHRDIKPENLLLDKDGRIKIADFGIAKMLGDVGDSAHASNESHATHASTVGTPGYMAPEQASAPQTVDARADIYSLGVVFYEMLTGELPGAKLQPPSKKVQIDVRLDEIVLRALEQTPERRYQTAADMRTQVERVTHTPLPVVVHADVLATPAFLRVVRIIGVALLAALLTAALGFVFLAGYVDRGVVAVFLACVGGIIGAIAGAAWREGPSSGKDQRLLTSSPAGSGTSIRKIGMSTLTTPAEIGTVRGQFFCYRTRGQLILDDRQLTHTRAGVTTIIPLAAIRDVSIGQYPRSMNPVGIGLLSIAYDEGGQRKQVLLSPMEGFFGLPSTWNARVSEWHAAIYQAVAATGRAPTSTRAEQLGIPSSSKWAVLMLLAPMLLGLGPFVFLQLSRSNDMPLFARVGPAVFVIGIIMLCGLGPFFWLQFFGKNRGRKPSLVGLFIALLVVLGLIAAGVLGVFERQRALTQPTVPQPIPAAAHPERVPGSVRSLAGPPFIARLPDGGSIELLAVREHPSTNQPWWGPDGSPSTYDTAIDAERKEQVRPGVMALARFTYPTNMEHWPKSPDDARPAAIGLGNGPRFAVKNGRRLPMFESDSPPRPAFGVICFENVLARGNDATLFVPVATAEWQTLTVQQPGGLLARFFDATRQDWKFSATPLGNLKVSITHLNETPGMEYRLVAVDLDGKRFIPMRTARSKKSTENFSSFEAEFDGAGGGTVGLPFNRIREIRWEERPYHQVEFRNVSLEPGHRTTVEVMDFGDTSGAARAAAPGAPSIARPQPPLEGRAMLGAPMTQQATDGGLSLFSPVVGERVGSNEFRAVTTIVRPRHVAVLTFEVESAQGRVEVPELSYYAVAFAPPMPFATLASWSVETRPDGLTSFRMTSDQQGSWSSRPLNGLLDYVWKATPPDRSFWVGPGEWHLNDTNTLSIFEGVSRNDSNQRANIRMKFSLFALPENFTPARRGQVVQPGPDWRVGLGLDRNVPLNVTALSLSDVRKAGSSTATPATPTFFLGVPWFTFFLVIAVLGLLVLGMAGAVWLFRRKNVPIAIKVLAVLLPLGLIVLLLTAGALTLWRFTARSSPPPPVAMIAPTLPLPVEMAQVPQQIDFKVTRVENPPGTRNIVLHFERDANPVLGIEVWQDVRPSQTGQQPAPGYRNWNQKYWVDFNGPRTLSWVLPQEFTVAEARALAKEMERKWKGLHPLPNGAVPEFGTAVHREGWKYHLLAKVRPAP